MAQAKGKEPVNKAPTLAEKLRMQLADDIVRGKIGPGVALDEADIAHRFQVSRTPVREAIRLLAASGLVQARPHRSAVVAQPDEAELIAMFEARQELEALCAGFAAERMTPAELKTLHQLNEALATIVGKGDTQAYYENNDRFHAAIYHGAHNSYLAELARSTRSRVAPFSWAQFQTLGRLERSYKEHSAIVEAISRRDAVGAAEMMRSHISIVRETYKASGQGSSRS